MEIFCVHRTKETSSKISKWQRMLKNSLRDLFFRVDKAASVAKRFKLQKAVMEVLTGDPRVIVGWMLSIGLWREVDWGLSGYFGRRKCFNDDWVIIVAGLKNRTSLMKSQHDAHQPRSLWEAQTHHRTKVLERKSVRRRSWEEDCESKWKSADFPRQFDC